MKKLVTGAAALLTAAAFAAQPKYPFGTVVLNGGRVEPVDMTLVESCNEHINFCFAARFPDNTIYLNHSKGIHTVTEYGCQDYSTDNGKTWQRSKSGFSGFNAYLDKQNRKVAIACWDHNVSDTHVITRIIMNPDGKSVTREKTSIKLPFRATFRLHRDVLRLKNGRLLLTGYARKENAPRFCSFVISSDDDGKTWQYHSTIMEDLKEQFPEGPNECAVIELANGDVLAYVRVGGNTPLFQLRSKDGGKTWGAPQKIAPFCVAPSVKILSDGTLVVITGRPKLYLLIDFTGTGEHYQKYTAYHGAGSSYASVLEVAPNQVLLLYDESDFGSDRNTAIFSRLIAMKLNVIRDNLARAAVAAHPEAAVYEQFYSPVNGMTPELTRTFVPSCYGKKSTGAWYEIRKIAERPHPVLHLEHKALEAPLKFANWNSTFGPGATSCESGFEFRLTEPGEKRAQFAVRFCFDDPANHTRKFGWVGFGVKEISYRDNGKLVRLPYDVGTDFKAFIVKGSLKTNTCQLFRKGNSKPLFTAKLSPSTATSLGFVFGDGATDVFGGADLSYIGCSAR